MNEKPASSCKSSGRRRRRRPSQNPAWSILAWSSDDEAPRSCSRGRRRSRAAEPGEQRQQNDCVPDTPEDNQEPVEATFVQQLLNEGRQSLAGDCGKAGGVAAGQAATAGSAPTPMLGPIGILLAEHDKSVKASLGQPLPASLAAGAAAGGTAPVRHPQHQQDHTVVENSAQLSHVANKFSIPPTGLAAAPARHQLDLGHHKSAAQACGEPSAPVYSNDGQQRGGLTANHAGTVHATPAYGDHVYTAYPGPRLCPAAQQSGGQHTEMRGGLGPGQALAAEQAQQQGAFGSTFLDRAVQLLRQESRQAALQQEQQVLQGQSAKAAQPASIQPQQAEALRSTWGEAAGLAGASNQTARQPPSDHTAAHASTASAMHKLRGAQHTESNRVSPSALRPVSYRQPAQAPQAARQSGAAATDGISAEASCPPGSLLAPQEVTAAPAALASRSPAEQLGLLRSGGYSAQPSAERTPLGPVGHRQLGAADSNTAGSKGSFSNFFSPLDDSLLAQIDSMERKAKVTQDAVLPVGPSAGPAAAAAAAVMGGRPQGQQGYPAALPAEGQVQQRAAQLDVPASARPPSTSGKSAWSDTPDSAVERMLQEVELNCTRSVALKSSPAPVRLLAFSSPLAPRPAPGGEAATAGLHAGQQPAAAGNVQGNVRPSSGGQQQQQPTSHLGRSALLQAQSGSCEQPGRQAAGSVTGAMVPQPCEPSGQPAGGVVSMNTSGPSGRMSMDMPEPAGAGGIRPAPQASLLAQPGQASGPVVPLPQQAAQGREGPLCDLGQRQLPHDPQLPEAREHRHTSHPTVQRPADPLQAQQPIVPTTTSRQQQQQQQNVGGGNSFPPVHRPPHVARGQAAAATAIQHLSPLKRPLPLDCSPQQQAGSLGQLARNTAVLCGASSVPVQPPSAGLGVPAAANGGFGHAAEPAFKRARVDRELHAAPAVVILEAMQLDYAGAGNGQAQEAGLSCGAQVEQQQHMQEAADDRGGDAMHYIAGDDTDDDSGDEENERNIPLLSQYVNSAQKLQRKKVQQPSPGAAARSPDPSIQPSPPANQLEAYLPPDVCEVFHQAGVTGSLYAWQAECLCQPGVLKGRNLVYCAPTSGGKSLVAEVLMVRRIMMTNRPAMLVLPFVSICSEKAAHLTRLLSPLNKEVKEFFGGNHSHASLGTNTGVIVCTIEKANILINRMLEDQTLGFLSCLVVDELHMVGDEDRGYGLELLLTKMMYAAAACDEEEDEDFLSEEGLQIIGMSATLPNVDVVAKWLKASLYQTDFRPVPVQQFIKVGREVRNERKEVVRTLEPPTTWDKADADHTVWLTKETVDEGNSVLVFCCSKNQCAVTAKQVARLLEVPEKQLPLRGVDLSQRPTRDSLCEELRRIPGGPDPALLEAMQRGVAFHHAGLSSEERDIVERAYKCGAVSVLCATSTLAAGVNLPARRVVFKHPYVGYYAPDMVLDGTKYRQMSGRAGRAGVDTYGESYLIAKDVPLNRLEALMVEGAKPIESCLVDTKRGMKRAMLEVVCAGVVKTAEDVDRYIRCTLLSAMNSFELVKDTTIAALIWLGQKEHAFLFWNKEYKTYEPTSFGKAVLASGLAPEMCMTIKADLERARESFVMTTELHLTYLCVPVMEDITPDWGRFYDTVRKLQGAAVNVMAKVGVNPGFAMQLSRGMGTLRGNSKRSEQQAEQERVCKRFWAALILTDLIQEVDMLEVQQKYSVPRGTVQGLQDRASRFASMVAAFCEKLGWYDMEALITKFQSRVLHGVRQEILALSEIPFVKSHTARLLYKAGLRTPDAVAAVSSVDQIVAILSAGAPPGDKKAALMRQRQALKILRGARELLSRRAKELKEQAAQALELAEKASAAEQQEHERAATAAAEALQEPDQPLDAPAAPEVPDPVHDAAADPQNSLAPPPLPPAPPQVQARAGQQAPSSGGMQQQQQQLQPVAPVPQHQPWAQPAEAQAHRAASFAYDAAPHRVVHVPLPPQQQQQQQVVLASRQGGSQHPGLHMRQPHQPPSGPNLGQQQGPPSLRASGAPSAQPHPSYQHPTPQQHHPAQQEQHPVQQQQQQQRQRQQQHPSQPEYHLQQQQQPWQHQQLQPWPGGPQSGQQQGQGANAFSDRGSGHGGRGSGQGALQGSGRGAARGSGVQLQQGGWQGRGSGGQVQQGSGRGRGSGGQAPQRGDEGSESDGDGDGAVLDAPPERELPPDPWDLADRPGPHLLTSPQQLRQMRAFLEDRYERFAFLFDISTAAAAPALELPAGPSAVRPRSPTKKEQREQAMSDKQSGTQVRLEGVALCWRDGQAVYIPLRGQPSELLAEVAALFASQQLEKATFDLKSQLALLVKAHGRGVLGLPERAGGTNTGGPCLLLADPLLDTRIAAWMATPEDKRLKDDNAASLRPSDNAYTVEALLRLKAGQPAVADATRGMHPGANNMAMRRIEACRKAASVRMLAHILLATLDSYGGMLAPLRQTEMPLVRVLVDMEEAGTAVSEAFLEAERPRLQQRLDELEKLAHQVAGQDFNLGSPAELSTILFEKLKLPPPPNATALKSGNFSTNGDVLRELASAHPDNPLPRLLLEHRKLSTLLGRYLNAFTACLRHAEPQRFHGGLVLRRIRGSFNQTCTETGRLSMEEPNLQTVPKPVTYTSLVTPPLTDGSGSASGNHRPHCFNMRCALVASPSRLLLSADYRQIEFRLMAHFSQDPGLLRMFSDDTIDPFKLLAARWMNFADPSQVTAEQRNHAKQLTYGILYGMGKGQLAEDLGCTEREAEAMMASFRNSLPGIKRWQEALVEQCRRDTFVTTSAGRRRWLTAIRAANGRKRSQAERQACNTVCQGSAADLVKAAMIAVHTRVAAELPAGSCQLLLQIHDELLFEVDEGLVVQAGRLVKECMEGVAQLAVPLRVRLACGPSWGDLREMEA